MGLKELRDEIDRIDEEILSLLNKRVEVVLKIKEAKRKKGLATYNPPREKEVYKRLLEKARGPFPHSGIIPVYREIMSACLFAEAPLKVAYLGPEATFTHLAAKERFGSQPEFVPKRSIQDVFIEVEKGRANYGVVPVESSTEGAVTHTLDMFIDSDLKIYSEILLEVSHSLLSNTELSKITEIYSHPHAFSQTKGWLESNLKGVPCIEVSSTSEGAKMAAKKKNGAAIASTLAAEIYGLKIIAKGIEDNPKNITRFLVIGKDISEKTSNDKTSILFSVKDRVGALYSMLEPFARHGVNLTKIESRPSKRQPFEYVFFLDLQGHIKDKNVKEALKDLEERCLFLKVLGSYPKDG
ncbi:MAG: prephenate dehydratase [bacterium]|nr:prephenate dehydratase [bacterium]